MGKIEDLTKEAIKNIIKSCEINDNDIFCIENEIRFALSEYMFHILDLIRKNK